MGKVMRLGDDTTSISYPVDLLPWLPPRVCHSSLLVIISEIFYSTNNDEKRQLVSLILNKTIQFIDQQQQKIDDSEAESCQMGPIHLWWDFLLLKMSVDDDGS